MTSRLRSTFALALAFVVPFALYLVSARVNVSFWDTGDLQTVPYILGIPYPTGFPGYVLLGWAWSHALPIGSVAWRMNALSSFAGAITCALLAYGALRMGAHAAVAVGCAWLYAVGKIPWEHATYADVHTLGLTFVVAALVAALDWIRSAAPRALIAATIAYALALAVDTTSVLGVPGFALMFVARPLPLRRRLALIALLSLIVASCYAYLPIRSAIVTIERRDPTLALGIAPGRPFWDDHHPATVHGFIGLVSGSEFHTQSVLSQALTPSTITRIVTAFVPALLRDLGAPLVWLAVFGAFVWLARNAFVAGALLALGGLPLLFVFGYAAEADVARYFGPAFVCAALFGAYGATTLARALLGQARVAGALAAIVAAAYLAQLNVRSNISLVDQRTDRAALDWVNTVIAHTPADAVIVSEWSYATPLAYAAYVEGRMGSRIIVTAAPNDFAQDYRGWLAAHQRVYIVASDPPNIPGFAFIARSDDDPRLFELR